MTAFMHCDAMISGGAVILRIRQDSGKGILDIHITTLVAGDHQCLAQRTIDIRCALTDGCAGEARHLPRGEIPLEPVLDHPRQRARTRQRCLCPDNVADLLGVSQYPQLALNFF